MLQDVGDTRGHTKRFPFVLINTVECKTNEKCPANTKNCFLSVFSMRPLILILYIIRRYIIL